MNGLMFEDNLRKIVKRKSAATNMYHREMFIIETEGTKKIKYSQPIKFLLSSPS